jgi:hypothetical protein
MNIGFSASRRKRGVTLFTWVWLTGSLIASAYFAFWLFPEIYAARTNSIVQVWFQVKPTADDPYVYYPNQEPWRKQYRNYLSDRTYLFFSACEILPLSQRPFCDSSNNWRALPPSVLNCVDVATCSTGLYTVNEDQRHRHLAGLNPVSGASFSIADLAPLSLSDPVGWGNAARWPLFFVCLFLALKLGRSLGEFLFLSYEK